jgi:hypothetical protein
LASSGGWLGELAKVGERRGRDRLIRNDVERRSRRSGNAPAQSLKPEDGVN